MGANSEQVLNDATGKAGVVRIASGAEVKASDFGFDSFTWIKPKGLANATLKAKSVSQIKNGSNVVCSDFSTTGVYDTGSAETLLLGDCITAEYSAITVSTGEVWAGLGRKTTTLQAGNPK